MQRRPLRQVTFDAFTNVVLASSSDTNGYLPLGVTRSCYDASSGQYVTRQYSVIYDTQSGRNGLPDGDDELRNFCGDYEQSLPPTLN